MTWVSGQLRVIAGLYRRETMQRLWPADPRGRLPDNFVTLGLLADDECGAPG